MRNLTPSTLAALPPATHKLADLEAAFNARRRQLAHETESATLVGRILHMLRLARPVHTTWEICNAQPTMSWVDGPRSQPRDGRGRFLPRTWLADAELFLPSDRAFFRKPLTTNTER
jgi:hypothetical protein